MMPGIGFFEMVLLVVVAIVVVGPKELPLMMRKFGKFTGKMRSLAFEFKQGFDELGRQAELDELRKEVADLRKHTGLDEITRDLEKDRIDLEADIASAMTPAAMEESRLLSESANSIMPPVTSVQPELPPAEPAMAETPLADASADAHTAASAEPAPQPAPAVKQDEVA